MSAWAEQQQEEPDILERRRRLAELTAPRPSHRLDEYDGHLADDLERLLEQLGQARSELSDSADDARGDGYSLRADNYELVGALLDAARLHLRQAIDKLKADR